MNHIRHLCHRTLCHIARLPASSNPPALRNYLRNAHAFSSKPATVVTNTASTTTTAAATKKEHHIESERLYVVAHGDPDRFGSQHTPGLAVKRDAADDTAEDAGDRAEERHLQEPPKRSQQLRTKQYADLIKDHLRNRRIKEAIDVLEVRMLKEDRVKPENYIYNLLIGECGRLGYTKKAFGLFTRMKQRGLQVTGGTYTALFNACAMTPWPQDGLLKANHLRQVMLEKGYKPNATNFNAMIKAYGRGGDLETAFRLVDEMQTKRMPVNVQTFNFVLQACASDKAMGFRHALLVWHKMLHRRMQPDVFSFNLMLRCVRDCGIGDLETMQEVIQRILAESRAARDEAVPLRLEANEADNVLQIERGHIDGAVAGVDETTERRVGGDEAALVDTTATRSETVRSAASAPRPDDHLNAPNLLSVRPHLGRLVALAEVRKPEDRLLLLGGMSGFLQEMQHSNATPDIKTYTQLVEVLPATNAAEKRLLAQLKRDKCKVDIDFFNVLMKKRSMRFDYEAAREVLELVRIADLQADIVTYGVLSLCCKTPEEADELMQEMLLRGVRMNIQILGAMLRQGCARRNFAYVLKIMQIVLVERIKPNEQFLMHLVRFRTECYEFRASGERYAKSHEFRTGFKEFCERLEQWRVDMGLHDLTLKEQIATVREHPWEQFKYAQPDGVEEVKNPKQRHKGKLRRHVQRIRPDQMRDDDADDSVDDRKNLA